jgi:hypothetical protein|tara:strand:- start:3094 stop:3606 length:513 start_codon:yes stop_codon:yes gene_type:complete
MDFTILRVLKAHSILLLTSLALFTVGCEDDDHDEHGHEEGHTDAEGFKLEDENGNEVYSQFEGAIEGAITLNVGETLELTVHFLDDDGNEIEHEEEEEGEDHEDGLEVSGADPNIAIVEVEGHEDEGDGHDHGMGIHIEGVSSGTTNFELRLMHQGHADFTSLDVLVTVN